MRNRLLALSICTITHIFAGVLMLAPQTSACTSLLVTKGATADGSVIITYTCDGEFHPRLKYSPARDYKSGDSLEVIDWEGGVRGKIKQIPHAYARVGLMNEHQLVIGESTFGGRKELENPEGLLNYATMMDLALQRAKTAREAVKVMTDLVREYGYRSTGESFSIGDPNEAWILEMIGPGPGGKGAEWVAVRVPDGYISCHANKARIAEFPLNDPDNCLYSDSVISFAVKNGYYDPKSGKPFQFCEVYCPPTPENQRYADARVWTIFRRAAPSAHLSPDYHRAVPGAKPYPLWMRPDKKLSAADVFAIMRDHYEGTEYDMTKGIDAGPYGSPVRYRPITWAIDSVNYAWERPISTQQTAFSFVSQSRSWLPDPIGGLLWYGMDDTYTTCYVPMYCGIDSVPRSFATGSLDKFSWDSAWWVFNFVANYANLRYCDMIKDILPVQIDLEKKCLALQPSLEKTALGMTRSDPDLVTRYLTDYCVSHAESVVARWRELGERLITKYNDGYVKDEKGHPTEKGYPEEWLREVLKSRPEQFRLGK